MNKSSFVALQVIWSALPLLGQPAAIIVNDTSRSQSRWAAQSKAEQKQLIAALPNGSRLVILGVGNSVRRVYEGQLDVSHRPAANATIDAMPANDQNTALGEGISEALRVSAGILGTSKDIWVFTDGQNSPPQSSRYRGVHLNQILERTTVPPDTQLHIRVFGDEPVLSNQAAVHVMKSAPTWNNLYSSPATAPRDATPVRPRPTSRELVPIVWTVGAIATFLLLGLLGLMITRRKRFRDMVSNVAPIIIPEPAQSLDSLSYKMFLIFIEGRNEPVVLAPHQRPEVLIGGSAVADIVLPGCEKQMARFQLAGTDNSEWVVVSNDGAGAIEIGRRRLTSGNSTRLPDRPVEIRIGSQILHVMGETLVREESRI